MKTLGIKVEFNSPSFYLLYPRGYTVGRERFAGLNIRGFSTFEVFTKILSRCPGHKCSLFSTFKERHLYSRINLYGTPENCEERESLAQ